MNSPIRRLSLIVAVLFLSLLASTTYVHYVSADSLNDRPGNRRTLLDTYARERGSILVGGTPIAESQPANTSWQWLRTYPQGERYAHVTGYYSFIYGSNSLERAENGLLSGTADRLFYKRLMDTITARPPVGASLQLTIDGKAQAAAEKALGGRKGAVVALDPQTGAILAMVSAPTYDPGTLSSHDAGAVQKQWEKLNTDEDSPLLNRAINGRYPPGSTFKIVTAAAALESGKYQPDSPLNGPAEIRLPDTNTMLPNFGRVACGQNGKTTLYETIVTSCNTSLVEVSQEVGGDAIREQAKKFGFDQSLQVPMNVTESVFPKSLNNPQTAQSAIGQYDVSATPLQMAMVSSAVANKGTLMKPYLVQTVMDKDLNRIDSTDPQEMSQAVSEENAQALSNMMVDVVRRGSGTQAQIPGVDVGGKTGTAQFGKGSAAHAWFMGFAPQNDPKVAVAVIVESSGEKLDGGTGGRISAPVAKAVMEAVINE